MQLEDLCRFSFRTILSYRLRTVLMLCAMAIGVASVVLLVSLGESARNYVLDQFSSMGTNLLIVLPGRSETTGGAPPMLGETPRDLTLEDALALTHSSRIRRMAPIVVGSAMVSRQQLEREVLVIGTTSALYEIRKLSMEQGMFLPDTDPTRASAACILGIKVRDELFGSQPALGEGIRIGGRRFRVTGVLASKGVSMGDDMNDMVIIPVASAQSLFNTGSLFRIVVEANSPDAIEPAKKTILTTISARHDGDEDITVITQDAILKTFDRIFTALTMAVGGIAAISLVVAGVLIMNVMLIAVSNRRAEIGLLKALGAPRRQIIQLFLTESALLSLAGGLLGIIVAVVGIKVIAHFFPGYQIEVAGWAPLLACGVSLTTGLVFGVLPARRAALLEPALALARR